MIYYEQKRLTIEKAIIFAKRRQNNTYKKD
jgi:hypothetical protein